MTIRPLLPDAPGAEDNASGVATVTEILRVLMGHGYRPKRTLQFIVYAGEEMGLIGSSEIAKRYRDTDKNVIGVLNFDMTILKAPEGLDLVIVGHGATTDRDQNVFLARLTDYYLPEINWAAPTERRASDHLSWSMEGFRASMLTDTRLKDRTKVMHSPGDTLDAPGVDPENAVNFVKVGLAFLVEMGG